VGDLWYFGPGIPHSIQGLDPDGCEFLLVFDDGATARRLAPLATPTTCRPTPCRTFPAR
jgi:hypothetical protein